MTEYYIGLMSGTSVDSIDGALVSFNDNNDRDDAHDHHRMITIHATHSISMPKNIRADLLDITTHSTHTLSLEKLGILDNTLGNLFAECALNIIHKTTIPKNQIKAIGSHGQNIYHHPNIQYTLQIGNPNIIAQKTGIPTIHDFRRGDMALGGQGAPLAPLFHHAVFYSPNKNRVIINLGGIANITVLPSGLSAPLCGFDTGPANGLLDAICLQYFNQPYDTNGNISATGKIQENLLQALLQDHYFSKTPPKSTGKEYFNINWLNTYLINKNNNKNTNYLPQDLLATLTELTAITLSDQIKLAIKPINIEIFCCGGGVYNTYLLSRIQYQLNNKAIHQNIIIHNTETLGLEPQWVEAALFAWLAKMRIEEKSLDLKSTTGSTRPVVLGAIYCP